MTKAGFLCVLVFLVAAIAGGAAAANEVCAGLQSRLAALEMADRSQWEGESLAADPYGIERERLAVLKALAANRCQSPEARRNKRPNRIFAGLFGNKRPFRNGIFRQGGFFGEGRFGDDFSFGTYRTLCVRTCDGYYFPISYSASGHELQRNEAACRALCPGQKVSLYVQRNPGEDGGAMVSLSGEPYTALPAAFRYRREYDRSCACGTVDPATAAAFRAFAVPPPDVLAAVPIEETSGLLVPLPPGRLREDDPDTLANRAGGFSVGPARRESTAVAVYGEGPDGKVVRLVGPVPLFIAE